MALYQPAGFNIRGVYPNILGAMAYRRHGVARKAAYAYAPLLATGAYGVGRYLYNKYRGAGNAKSAARKAAQGVRYGKKFQREVGKQLKKQKPVAKLKRQVRDLNRKANDSLGTLIYRITDGAVQISNVNTAGNESFSLNTTTEIETVLAQLRYYNPSSPATLVTADYTTGSYSKKINIKHSVCKVTVRNNYQTPCIVRCWKMHVKTDNSINPETAWSNGLADISNGGLNDIHMYPSDSPQFTDLYKSEKEISIYLNPGKERTFSISCKSVHYDPSVVDSQTDTNQKGCSTKWMMFNVAGVISHDSSAAQYGCIGCGVDFLVKKTYVVEYEAGANIKYIYLSNNLDAFTNGALVSNMPISDNQGYSVN